MSFHQVPLVNQLVYDVEGGEDVIEVGKILRKRKFSELEIKKAELQKEQIASEHRLKKIKKTQW